MTKGRTILVGPHPLLDHDLPSMTFDLFEGAVWRKKISEPASDGTVKVQLSSGKTVTVDSQLLAVLRLLIEELSAEEDTRLN